VRRPRGRPTCYQQDRAEGFTARLAIAGMRQIPPPVTGQDEKG
jgi:hypothetical protein